MQYVEIELIPMKPLWLNRVVWWWWTKKSTCKTIFGDGSQQDGGFMGKLLGAGKRLLTGENYLWRPSPILAPTNRGILCQPLSCKIIPLDLEQLEAKSSARKTLFFAPPKGSVWASNLAKGWVVALGVKASLCKRSKAMAWPLCMRVATSPSGPLAHRANTLRVDTGCLVGFTKDVDYDIVFVGRCQKYPLWREGLFLPASWAR